MDTLSKLSVIFLTVIFYLQVELTNIMYILHFHDQVEYFQPLLSAYLAARASY